jgi:hypothetical protein
LTSRTVSRCYARGWEEGHADVRFDGSSPRLGLPAHAFSGGCRVANREPGRYETRELPSDLSNLVAYGTTPVRVSAKKVRVVDAPPLHRSCREIRAR